MPHNPSPSPGSKAPGVVFLSLGLVFLAAGTAGPSSLLAVGPGFLALGVVLLASSRRRGAPK